MLILLTQKESVVLSEKDIYGGPYTSYPFSLCKSKSKENVEINILFVSLFLSVTG